MNISKHIPKEFWHFRQHPLNTQCAWICATPCAPRVHVRVTSVAKPGTFTVGCRCSALQVEVAPARGNKGNSNQRQRGQRVLSVLCSISFVSINVDHVVPCPPLSNSSEHPQHVTACNFGQAINASKYPPPNLILTDSTGLSLFLAKWRSRWWRPPATPLQVAAVANRVSPQGCTCESSTTLEPEPDTFTKRFARAHGWIGLWLCHSSCEIFDR